jgi:hypothetical protein
MKTTIAAVSFLLLPSLVAFSQGITPEKRQAILDSIAHSSAPYGAISLAIDNNIVEALPLVQSAFWRTRQIPSKGECLEAMLFFNSSDLRSYARAAYDSAQFYAYHEFDELNLSNRVQLHDSLQVRVMATYYLLVSGDYSTVQCVFDLLRRERSKASINSDALRSLKEVARRVPQFADSAKAELRRIMKGAHSTLNRWTALYSYVEVYGREAFPELVDVATNDPDPDGGNRNTAIYYLYQLDYPDMQSFLRQRIAAEPGPAYRGEFADSLLIRYGTPQDYKVVSDYVVTESNDVVKRSVQRELASFLPPRPGQSVSVSSMIDNLIDCLAQLLSLNSIGNASYMNGLAADLSNAKVLITGGDSVGCARKVVGLQQRVDEQYHSSTNNNDKFVTLQGWKFIYYGAQYILDRLPQLPPSPVLVSLTPSSAVAGGSGFSLNVKGKSFVNSSVVVWNSSTRSTSLVADSLLQATILASDLATARTVSVAVVNPGNDTSNVLPFTVTQPPTGLNVKLISSSGTSVTGGSLQYYDGSWKDAISNNDGTFKVNTNLKTVSLRMTYEFATQTKSNVTVGYDTVAFQTVNAQVKLQNSQGAPIDTGTVQYYFSSWKTLGTTKNGVASKELLPGNYTFRMTYASATNDKQQDIGANPVVLFQTVNASVQLKNSQGTLMPVPLGDQGTVQYYFSSWKNFGATSGGVATKELLPGNYTFRMSYASATNDKEQNIGTNPTVVFQTVNTAIQLKNSLEEFIDQGTVQYYFSAWKAFGSTANGVATKELLPGNYTFRMSYASATNDKQQNIGTNPIVVFQTVAAAVQLKNSQGTLMDQGTVQYYFSSWNNLGSTTNGVATKELLPGNYTFRMTYAAATNDKQQNIGTNPTVLFQTVNATVQLQNSLRSPIDQGTVQYYFSSWNNFGSTTGGVVTKELLPGNYTFRMTYAAATNDKQQNIGTNATVLFQTVNATVQLQNSLGTLMDQGTVQYYFSSWNNFGSTASGVATKELLPGNYTFRMTYAAATNDKQQNIGTNATVLFQTVNATVQLKNSLGALIDQGTVQYYFSSWNNFGATANGVVAKELLPGTYTFRMTHESVTNDKAQNISTNNTVTFSTVMCTVSVKNGQNQPVDNAMISFYFNAWKQIGPTVNGQVTKELLPANLTFRMTLGTATQNKQQNIGMNGLVEFVVQ